MAMTAAHAADTEYLVRNAMTNGYQVSSLLVPPLYTAFILARRGRASFSVNRLLRATWLGGLAGSVGGGGLSYVRYAYSNEGLLQTRRLEAAYNNDRIRADDHAMIGTILMSVLTPAVLWNRAHILHLVLGGAGLGSSIGLLTHYGRSITGDPPPKSEVPVISISE